MYDALYSLAKKECRYRLRLCLNIQHVRLHAIVFKEYSKKEFYSYEKDLVCRFCIKNLIFIYNVHEKSLNFGRFIMPGNKLLTVLN